MKIKHSLCEGYDGEYKHIGGNPILEIHKSHTHIDDDGKLIKCYHECKNQVLKLKDLLFSFNFWIVTTIAFPLEHLIWKIGPLRYFADFFGI